MTDGKIVILEVKITELILTCVEFSTDVLVASEVSLTK